MSATEVRHDPEKVARLGTEILDRQLRPALRPEDDGKFVAIDIDSGDHELDADDYEAVSRLRARRPKSGSGGSASRPPTG